MTWDAVDLFAGPGGWDVAAQALGLSVLGIERDAAACDTRRAGGLPTIEGDVRTYSPDTILARGLIGSAPCQTFSVAGKGAGRRNLDAVYRALDEVAAGRALDPTSFTDERTLLVTEPLRWAVAAYAIGRPYEWIALEQVPTVLPVWFHVANHLRDRGYAVSTEILHAEAYGVPQTRKRAILVARLNGPADLPVPTHSRYYPRSPKKLDPGVPKWVSMAEALGWPDDTRVVSNYRTGGTGTPGVRTGWQPSATVTSKVDRNRVSFVSTNDRPNVARRALSEPAPTLAFGHERPRWVFERPSTTIVGSFKPEIVAGPGYRTTVSRQNAPGSIRVSVEEAATLQSFPAGYPWQGSKTKQFQQIGNAIPPLLASHVLCSAAGIQTERMTA